MKQFLIFEQYIVLSLALFTYSIAQETRQGGYVAERDAKERKAFLREAKEDNKQTNQILAAARKTLKQPHTPNPIVIQIGKDKELTKKGLDLLDDINYAETIDEGKDLIRKTKNIANMISEPFLKEQLEAKIQFWQNHINMREQQLDTQRKQFEKNLKTLQSGPQKQGTIPSKPINTRDLNINKLD